MQDVANVPLFRDLQQRDVRLFARALDLRDAAARWLTYIPSVFPHYTLHTVEHSDAIVRQLSHILYGDSPGASALQLSPVEIYILIVSAYLHDAGMVASTREQVELMRGAEWQGFVDEGGPGHQRMVAIQELRQSARPSAAEAGFLADVQLRFLLAEFIRRTHHQRSGAFLTEHAVALAQFDLGDPLLLRSIRAVCVGHGLSPSDLNDPDEYPERRTVQGDHVNVRLLAGLLRVGDLLDMSTDRACPLLLSAASPLPNDSYAHWSQYRRITHQLVAPDRIEISAECEDRDEHSFLSDWCTWLVREVDDLALSMLHARRHRGWAPPRAAMSGNAPTIRIAPSPAADYVPARWRLELDSDRVLDRLIHDAYGSPETAFLRELLQNAADTNRCRLVADLEARGGEIPPSPQLAPPDMLARYPIRIVFSEREVDNRLSGEKESRFLVTIEDAGMGMTADVIRSFLLQVGRSFYRTPAFRRRFSFEPASRFGIGFLSVFAVSDHVEIDTFSVEGPSPLHLALPGPRAFVLVQRGNRMAPGTAISVLLRPGIDREALITEVRRLRGRLEFPVFLDVGGGPEELPHEVDDDFVVEVPDVTEPGSQFRVESFPIKSGPLNGSLFVFTHERAGVTSWTSGPWAGMEYPAHAPGAKAPDMPDNALFFHGLYAGKLDNGMMGRTSSSFGAEIPTNAARIDIRGPLPGVTLDRKATHSIAEEVMSRLQPHWEELLLAHAEDAKGTRGEDAWRYLQELMDAFPFVNGEFWHSMPGTVRYWRSGWHNACIDELVGTRIAVPLGGGRMKSSGSDLESGVGAQGDCGVPVVQILDGLREGSRARMFLLRHRSVLEVGRCGNQAVAVLSEASPAHDALRLGFRETGHFVEIPDSHLAAWVMPFPHTHDFSSAVLINTESEFGAWLQSAKQAADASDDSLLKTSVNTVVELTSGAAHGIRDDALPKLERFLSEWRRSSDLPPSSCPPDLRFDEESFSLGDTDRMLRDLEARGKCDLP